MEGKKLIFSIILLCSISSTYSTKNPKPYQIYQDQWLEAFNNLNDEDQLALIQTFKNFKKHLGSFIEADERDKVTVYQNSRATPFRAPMEEEPNALFFNFLVLLPKPELSYELITPQQVNNEMALLTKIALKQNDITQKYLKLCYLK